MGAKCRFRANIPDDVLLVAHAPLDFGPEPMVLFLFNLFGRKSLSRMLSRLESSPRANPAKYSSFTSIRPSEVWRAGVARSTRSKKAALGT